MSTISLTIAKRIALLLIVVSLIFYLTNLPSTYSHFTSRAEPEELVLQSGHWEVVVDIDTDLSASDERIPLEVIEIEDEEDDQGDADKVALVDVSKPKEIVTPEDDEVFDKKPSDENKNELVDEDDPIEDGDEIIGEDPINEDNRKEPENEEQLE